MKHQYRILLVDDHPIFLKGLVEVMQDEFPKAAIHSFLSSVEALESAKSIAFDMAILDLDMPQLNGIELSTALKKQHPSILTIILTMHKEVEVMLAALSKGVDGYVLKDDIVDELVIAVEEVQKGNKYRSDLDRMNGIGKQNYDLKLLTKTELLILKGVSLNKTSQQLAEELFVSIKTIQNHRNNISKKLNIQGSNSLLKFALNNKDFL